MRYLEEVFEIYCPVILNYSYNGSTFSVLACPKDTLSVTGWSDEKDIRSQALEKQLGGLIGEACLSLIQELAPFSIPEPRTLQERIYPLTYSLRVFTEDGRLASQVLTDFEFSVKYPPIPEDKLQEIGLDDTLPIFDASQIVLGPRL
ncbi:hypothetical protein NA56DRAFT_709014 [Hyaloscypha hepaticicola]|uniref:Uncharacterized protein n=1 Tax=Hyaloscypha hepaticicola TaxID=2082293 RepID=A0A2J6PQA4_9HELO|nr:hypothetical protein NA56DRAFT_709014 [Hyaloscypha hepaticicola]